MSHRNASSSDQRKPLVFPVSFGSHGTSSFDIDSLFPTSHRRFAPFHANPPAHLFSPPSSLSSFPGTGQIFALAKRGWNKLNNKGQAGSAERVFTGFRVCYFDFFRIRVHFVFFRVSSTFRFVRSSFPLLRLLFSLCKLIFLYISIPFHSLVLQISFPCEPLLTKPMTLITLCC